MAQIYSNHHEIVSTLTTDSLVNSVKIQSKSKSGLYRFSSMVRVILGQVFSTATCGGSNAHRGDSL